MEGSSSVVFKLTHGGGPEPVLELKRVFEAAQEDPAGVTWIATRKPGSKFTASPDSELLAFAQERAGKALALRARIVSRHETLPSNTLVTDMYEDYKDSFRAYWKITDVRLGEVLVEELPGTTRAGLRIADAFRSQLSFAYWLPAPPDECGPAPQPLPVPGFAAVRRSVISSSPLHGVDFSGAHELSGRNGKIWIASWYPDRDFVELRSGGSDPGFDRVGLAGKVVEGSGTWVIDFPFGPPADVAEAAAGTHGTITLIGVGATTREHFATNSGKHCGKPVCGGRRRGTSTTCTELLGSRSSSNCTARPSQEAVMSFAPWTKQAETGHASSRFTASAWPIPS